MHSTFVPRRRRSGLLAVSAAFALTFAAGCGGEDEGGGAATAAEAGSELPAVETYLTEHSAALREQVAILADNAEQYYELAAGHDFDYEALMEQDGDQVERIMRASKKAFVEANPSYEEMEGIVAGVPRLAQYDVDIDAGSDGSDPESAVSFSLETPSGQTLKQPGNLFFLTETALYGTNEDLLADVSQDVDGDGKEEFGEGVPDAEVYVATLRKFREMTEQLDADAQEFRATPSDALTAITVMTPTMSEYFEAWKNSAFIAGEDAEELGFVATSRLSDIADILEGILFTYREIEPTISEEDPQQAQQTRQQLEELLAYVTDLRDREERGEKFTGEQADALGSEAQARAEEIAGQVTQAANRLGIELQDV